MLKLFKEEPSSNLICYELLDDENRVLYITVQVLATKQIRVSCGQYRKMLICANAIDLYDNLILLWDKAKSKEHAKKVYGEQIGSYESFDDFLEDIVDLIRKDLGDLVDILAKDIDAELGKLENSVNSLKSTRKEIFYLYNHF